MLKCVRAEITFVAKQQFQMQGLLCRHETYLRSRLVGLHKHALRFELLIVCWID